MRDYRELNELDLKLCLLKGSSLTVDNLDIKPYLLGELVDFGHSHYMRNIQWVSLSVDDFIEAIVDEDRKRALQEIQHTLKPFDFYTKLGDEEFQQALIEALQMIFRTHDIRFLDENIIAIDFEKRGIFYTDEYGEISINNDVLESMSEEDMKVIHRDNFDNIVKIIKLQNYLIPPSEKEEEETLPADEETRLLMEQMEGYRRKVDQKKKALQDSDGENDIDIFTIIDAVSTKANALNKLSIWDYTVYMLYSEYARLEVIDNYNFSIQAMMAGAESVDLTHWSSKL
ncbi:hypothetical protein Q7A53_06175 [Halobacillus rhizosphaerae]|uniref:hypothetical protein n=1 Tax=Halobacillus rhizosphaerae TaxID=3064889 RepID=UPI00398AE6EE